MKNETKEERNERKDMYVSRAVAMGADYQEAVDKFEQVNGGRTETTA